MISCFRYTFSEYEIDEILNNKNDLILNTEVFKANNNKEYELVIRTKCYYVTYEDKPIGQIHNYEKDLLMQSIAEINLGKDHCLYLLLDASENITDKRAYHINKVNHITTNDIACSYIELLAYTINFSNDDEFLYLCFLYLVYRLKYKDRIDFNLYFRGKLDYYGYNEEDFLNKVPFNNSTNPNFLKIVNLALEVLYNFATYDMLNLKEYSLTMMKLKQNYLKYFYSKIY